MDRYIIATIKDWNINQYIKSKYQTKKNFFLISDPKKLTFKYINSIKPKYIFFPHWSKKINTKIINNYECVGFHSTDLPYGRGGSPIQNLINKNHKITKITAFKMTKVLDGGPIYLKKSLKLKGSAEQIYKQASIKIFKMINLIIKENIIPINQKGKIVNFKRRKPNQSKLSREIKSLKKFYNHIRMLDAKTYPPAFINYGKFRIEFKKANINSKNINVNASIKIK